MALFEKYGYEAVGVEDIVKAAGISVGTFYHYYKNKDELIIVFLERNLQKSYDEYEETVLIPMKEEGRSAADRLFEFIHFSQGLPHEGGQEFLRVAYTYMLREPTGQLAYNFVLDPNRSYARICKELLIEGQENGEFRPEIDPEFFIKFITPLVNVIDFLFSIGNRTTDIRSEYKAIFRQMVDSLRCEKA